MKNRLIFLLVRRFVAVPLIPRIQLLAGAWEHSYLNVGWCSRYTSSRIVPSPKWEGGGILFQDGGNKGRKSLSDAVLKRIAALCPNLQVLHLMDYNTKNFTFESLPTSIVRLEMVHCILKLGWMTDKQKHLPKLEHLHLENCFTVNDSVMEDISVWRNLKDLSIIISGRLCLCKVVGNAGVIIMANNLYELEYLNICYANIDDDAVYHITLHLKKLKQLRLAYCYGVTDKSVVQIAMGLPVLNKLDLSHCHQVTMRGLKTLIGGNIRELIVVGLTQLSKKEKQALKSCFAVTRFR